MSEFEDKLNSILSSPGQMEKIMELARSFSGSSGTPTKKESSRGADREGSYDSGREGSYDSDRELDHSSDKDAGQETDRGLGGLFSTDGLNPKMLQTLSRIMSSSSGLSNDKAVLLKSMRPYLKENRRRQMDKAVKVAKIAKIAKIAFSEFSGGDQNL